MSTSGAVIHYIEWGCQFPNPQEIHCLKWEFCVWFVLFWFVKLFQERIPGVEWDLPVHTENTVEWTHQLFTVLQLSGLTQTTRRKHKSHIVYKCPKQISYTITNMTTLSLRIEKIDFYITQWPLINGEYSLHYLHSSSIRSQHTIWLSSVQTHEVKKKILAKNDIK